MGRPPAYVFVVRHGNRLDAANKQWHLQSPTPYDPPLTYSGWNQARATGQRIAQILREREAQDEAARPDGPARKKRKFKVVLHSSPFLRCVQTSIGISAGLASAPESTPAVSTRTNSTSFVSNPQRPTINTDLPTPPETDSRPSSPKKPEIQKAVLRLDAFLGEWLNPGYFELITPPPGSNLMLASAKANLLRKEDYSNNPNFASYQAATGSNPSQMWGGAPVPSTPDSTLDNISSLAEALRRAGRSDSVTSVTSNGESRLLTGGAYFAPVPTYAISHNAEIPSGYVPHARDNCCDIDYQWDSMRGTLDWGDGGALGEEWTSMHKRFRKGLQKLVDWYATTENPAEKVTKTKNSSVSQNQDAGGEDEDVEVESVVIIVSHGAGCNALIGAITNKPVLTDVGLASLTEAVRKPGKDEVGGDTNHVLTGGETVSPSSGLISIHEYYDLGLLANAEHLSSTRSSRAASVTVAMNSAMNSTSRGRPSLTFASSPLSINTGLYSADGSTSRGNSAAANMGGMRRASEASSRMPGRIGLATNGGSSGGITVGSGVTSFLRQTPSAGGLWSPLRNNLDTPDDDDDNDDNFLPNFSSFDNGTSSTTSKAVEPEEPAKPATAELSTPISFTNDKGFGRHRSESQVSPRYRPAFGPKEPIPEEHEHVSALPQLGSGAGGLWGSPKPIGEESVPRDMLSPKRRWTVTERC